jgi:hypothetical protein
MKGVGSDQNEKLREAASFGDAHAVRVLLKVKNQSQYKLSHFVKVPFCQVPSLQSLKKLVLLNSSLIKLIILTEDSFQLDEMAICESFDEMPLDKTVIDEISSCQFVSKLNSIGFVRACS